MANERGGDDNITVIVTRFDGSSKSETAVTAILSIN
jgi:serine/threonine protein phosphatase PrpC